MSLKLSDNFTFDPRLDTYDFLRETPAIYKLRNITNFTEVTVSEEALTILAYRAYGNHNLWWILAVYNNIVSVDAIEIDVIKIPDYQEVIEVLQ